MTEWAYYFALVNAIKTQNIVGFLAQRAMVNIPLFQKDIKYMYVYYQ